MKWVGGGSYKSMKWVGNIFFNLNTPSCFALFLLFAVFFKFYFQNPYFINPDLGPNCLQRLSADCTSRQRVNQLFDSGEKGQQQFFTKTTEKFRFQAVFLHFENKTADHKADGFN